MGDPELKEVRFNKYCKKCRWDDRNEVYDPCNDCLEISMREGTEKPYYYEEEWLDDKRKKQATKPIIEETIV